MALDVNDLRGRSGRPAMRECQTLAFKYPSPTSPLAEDVNPETHYGCREIQKITGREHLVQKEHCEQCHRDITFLVETIVRPHAIGLAERTSKVDLERLVSGCASHISKDFAREVLMAAAVGGRQTEKRLVDIAKSEGLA